MNKSQERIKVKDLIEWQRQGLTSQSEGISDAQRKALKQWEERPRLDMGNPKLLGLVKPAFLPESLISKGFVSNIILGSTVFPKVGALTVGLQFESVFQNAFKPKVLPKVGGALDDFKKNFAVYCARDYVLGLFSDDAEREALCADALETMLAFMELSLDKAKCLEDYTAELCRYTQVARDDLKRAKENTQTLRHRLEEVQKELSVANERGAHGDKFRYGQRYTENAGQKRLFIEHIQEKQIVLERISDLEQHMEGIARAVSGIEKRDAITLKGWYKEAMPHIKFKQGRPPTKK